MIKKISMALLGIVLAVACTKKQNSGTSAENQVSTENEIVIGEYGSLSGAQATFGLSTHKGIKLAVDEANKKGGVKGKQLKLVEQDDQGKETEVVTVVNRLINQYKAVAILGEVASGLSLVAGPIAQQNKVPMISPSSTNPDVTKVGDYIFRVCFIDPFQGTVMAKFAYENLKVKKVAVFKDVSLPYSKGLAEYFVKKFKELGGEIVSEENYSKDDKDFKAQLTKIRSANPEALFIPGYYNNVGQIALQARMLDLKVPLMGGDGWDSPKLFEIGKEAIQGSYFSNHYTSESTDPVVVEFSKKYKEVYNEVPDGLAAMGYDAAKVLIAAMERASVLSPKAIRDEIAKTKDFGGVTGKITIDQDRNAVKAAVVVKVDGTVNRFVTTIAP